MLFSHHAPVDYDRTVRVGSVHLCSRCMGVALGTVVAVALWHPRSFPPVVVLMALAVPGVLDFTLHELGVSASSTMRRVLSGLIFGVYGAGILGALAEPHLSRFAILISWFFVLQMAVAMVLSRFHRLEPLLKRYEEGMHIRL